MKSTQRMSLVLLMSVAAVAGAQEETPVPEAPAAAHPFRAGWYVAPMATYMIPDGARCNVDSGLGGSLALGHRGEFASLEFWGQFLSLSHGECNYTVPDGADDGSEPDPVTEPSGTVKLNGGGLGLVVGPFFEKDWAARFFGVVGFGVLLREDHPQYQKDVTTIFGDAGVGYLYPFQAFGRDLNARADLRYRYDVQQPPHPDEQDPAPAHDYGDVIFNLGLQIPLSQPEKVEAPASAPVAVVPAAFADTDNDGVIDERDQCPDTPAGSYVDNVGCPQAQKPSPPPAPVAEPMFLDTAKAGDRIVLKGVTFETNRATLTSNARAILDGVSEALLKRAELRVEIGGHTDDRGSDAYNQDLSQRRAESVMAYLVEHGVDGLRLTAVGYGEAQPADTNTTNEGRERNRRVELKVLE